MRRPPIRIHVSRIANEIIKAGAAHKFLTPDQMCVAPAIQVVMTVVQKDRIKMTDHFFRQKYVDYIKRGLP